MGSLGRVGMSKSRSQPLVCTEIYELALYITKHLHDIFSSYGKYSLLFMFKATEVFDLEARLSSELQ